MTLGVSEDPDSLDDLLGAQGRDTNGIIAWLLIQAHQDARGHVSPRHAGGCTMVVLPDALAKVTVRCMDLLRVHELPVGGHDIELMLIDADLQLVVCAGMDEVDPDPLLALLGFEHLEWREGLLTQLLIGVQVLIGLHPAAKRVPPGPTDRLDELWGMAEGPALVVEDDGVAAPWHDTGVSVHHEEDVHPLGIPVADHDMVRVLLGLSHGLNVMFRR